MPLDEEALQTLLRACQASIIPVDELAEEVAAQLNQGVTLGEMRGLTPQHYATLYSAATELCTQERFIEAAQIAVQLVTHEPRDHRYALLAGIALHRLERWSEAAAMYGLSLQARPTPIAAYRLGECLVEEGRDELALQCFAAVEELCDESDEQSEIRFWATECAQAVRDN